MFLFIVDQCCKEDMVSEVSSKVLLEVSERNWKIRLDYWFGSIARCGKGR